MKARDIKELSEQELQSKLVELHKELVKHNAQIAIGTTPKSPGAVKQAKKTIAKIKTILNQRRK